MNPDVRPGLVPHSTPPATHAALFAFVAWAISALHYATFFDVERPIYTDVRYFLYFAWRLAEGDVAHLELFDNKTFLANFVGAGLYRLGGSLGLDPLHFIRASMLALASFGGLLAYWVFRRIGHGSVATGFLGLFALLSFGILGELPAIGNFPKLLMGLFIPAAALAIARGYWTASGVCSALAFLDWQVGALVGGAAVVCALCSGNQRGRNTARVILGGLLGLAPFVFYYALHGALGAAIDQTFAMSLARASDSIDTMSWTARLEKIAWTAGRADPEQRALMLVSLVGLPVSWAWCWREWGTSAGRLLLALCLTHTGLFVFSLTDFQRFGDFYVLMLTSAFWLGIAWAGALGWAAHWAGPEPRKRRAAIVTVLALALIAARPFTFRAPIDLRTKHVPPSVTLGEQREVAAALRQRIEGRTFVALASSEILFLMRYENPLPIIYLNVPSHLYNAHPGEETPSETAGRLIESTDPDLFVYPLRHPLPPRLQRNYTLTPMEQTPGGYRVRVYERN